jgi:hypothetical protein
LCEKIISDTSMNSEFVNGSSSSGMQNTHFARVSNQTELLRSMVLDFDSISDDELRHIVPTAQGML